MISFVMPAYKSEYLDAAIKSILSQTYRNWELVIVDDASPDNLEAIVRRYDDARIRYYRNEANIGGENLVRQWNHSIGFAEGEWIVLAADDDVYAPSFCSECIKLVGKYPDVNVVRSRVLQIRGDGAPLWEDGKLSEFTNKYEYLHDWMTAKAFTCVGNFMFRKSALMAMGGFIDFPCGFCSDIATPIALSTDGVANTSEMLFSFRQSDLHLSADNSHLKEKLAATSQLFEWLAALKYEDPVTDEDKAFYAVHDASYMHAKCVYDYFNQAIRFVPFCELIPYLKLCRLATTFDKMMMVARWFKRRLISKS